MDIEDYIEMLEERLLETLNILTRMKPGRYKDLEHFKMRKEVLEASVRSINKELEVKRRELNERNKPRIR
jgi:hypothetical protein